MNPKEIYKMKILYIIRGLPGSGKTTLAKRLTKHGYGSVAEAVRFEADDFFVDKDGVYDFDPDWLTAAHNSCQIKTIEAMHKGIPIIAIANTFSMQWEAEPYFSMAEKYEYTTVVIECQNKWKNTHDVPEEVIENMEARWEAII